MTLVAGTILGDAEALAYPYVSKRAAAPGPLLRTLTTLDAEVTGMCVSSAPHLVSVDATPLTMALSSNAAGYALTAAQAYTDFKLEDGDGVYHPIKVVPESNLDHAPVHPAVVVTGGRVYPCDRMEKRWADTSEYRKFFTDGDKIHYKYIADNARITALTGNGSTLVSPDFAGQYFTWMLAYMILLSFHGVEGVVPDKKLMATVEGVGALRAGVLQSLARAVNIQTSSRSAS